MGPTTAATNSKFVARHAPLSCVPIPISGLRICLARCMRSGGEMGKVEVAKAVVVSTSPGRMIGEAGALKAVTTAVVTASMVAVAAVFMVMIHCCWLMM